MIYRNFKRDIEVISLEKVLLKPEVKKMKKLRVPIF
jgi:hypothetical protein